MTPQFPPNTADTADAGQGAVETAYRSIRLAIITGDLRPGEEIKETRLAQAIGISRTPVREALGRLASEGFVRMERYRRAQVASFNQADVAEIFRLRARLEAHGARRAAARITPDTIAQLTAIEDEMERVFDDLGWHKHLARFDALNNQFHGLIARAADSPRLERIIGTTLELPASIFNSYAEPPEERTRRTHRQHREIIDALRARNPDWAEAAMGAHLSSIVADPDPSP
jgi:DNA-binding GntR family transcriptional regulator